MLELRGEDGREPTKSMSAAVLGLLFRMVRRTDALKPLLVPPLKNLSAERLQIAKEQLFSEQRGYIMDLMGSTPSDAYAKALTRHLATRDDRTC